MFVHRKSLELLYNAKKNKQVRDESADEVAYHIAICQTIVTALRSIPYQAARGETPIPSELMVKHSIPSTYLFRPDNDSHKPALREAVYEMANLARWHLRRGRELQGNVPKQGRVSLLPAVSLELYLNKLESVADYDVLNAEL